jgi:hypothetical protein
MARDVGKVNQEISDFVPESPQPCEVCGFFPILLDSRQFVQRLNRQIKREQAPSRRAKLRRLRHAVQPAGKFPLHLHGEKSLLNLSILRATVPGVTSANWIPLRDYIFYGPRPTLSPGPGLLLYRLADYFCSRKTIHLIVLPAIADLRLEYDEALAEGRRWRALGIRFRGWRDLSWTVCLSLLRANKASNDNTFG